MYAEGDPSGFVRPYREALAEDEAQSGDMRRLGLVSALTLIAASALRELDRVAARPGAGQEWLQAMALRDGLTPD
jgi:hypothetical protein